MAVSKRLRYEVFRRDDFTCRYCGAKPPGAELTTDHVVPVTLGGSDEPPNLVSACKDCNSGKTSSTPDAPLVDDVAEDALRWSRAMAEAADRMRGEARNRQQVYDQFDGWWGEWTCGFKKLPVPRPDDWRTSVDTFLSAGLPLEVLRWCIQRAMGQDKIPGDKTWRYMCGIAWKKVTELQQAAQSIASGTTGTGEEVSSRSPDEYAECLLARLTDAERARAYRDEDGVRDEPPEDESGRASGALWWALNNLLAERSGMASVLSEILRAWPDARGQTALSRSQARQMEQFGPDFSEDMALIHATWTITEELWAAEADRYLATLPAAEREMWLERAKENDADSSATYLLIEAGYLAREAAKEVPA